MKGVLASLLPEMKRVTPKVGGKGTPVSIAHRLLSRRWCMVISISKATGAELGFHPTEKNVVEVSRDDRSGQMAVVLRPDHATAPDREWLWTMQNRQGTHVLTLSQPGLGEKSHTAERAPFQIVSMPATVANCAPAYLLITLPDWAAPMRVGMARAAAAAEVARSKAA